ncbi:MAG: hypothetical protein LKE51_14550, partial [Selenomonas sp.]|nr:hypothetical protein [Selenomonas sp.]
CTEEMLDTLGHNIDIFMTVGGPVTAEKAPAFHAGKICNGPETHQILVRKPKGHQRRILFQ